ncbi:MAG: hypothetical protein IJR25_06310 [Bacteroidales bacterium]|nr:hypothetical protein [Bacteroidales bacterium]
MLTFVSDKSVFNMASNADFVQYIVDQCSGAREHFYIDDVDDRDYLAAIVRATIAGLASL